MSVCERERGVGGGERERGVGGGREKERERGGGGERGEKEQEGNRRFRKWRMRPPPAYKLVVDRSAILKMADRPTINLNPESVRARPPFTKSPIGVKRCMQMWTRERRS